MGEAARERGEPEKPFDKAKADRVTGFGTVPAKRPMDLSPDASTLYDLIVAVKELQEESVIVRHAVREANWHVVSMNDRLADLMRHGDIYGLREDLQKIIGMLHELPDDLHHAINAPPFDDSPPPLAHPK